MNGESEVGTEVELLCSTSTPFSEMKVQLLVS